MKSPFPLTETMGIESYERRAGDFAPVLSLRSATCDVVVRLPHGSKEGDFYDYREPDQEDPFTVASPKSFYEVVIRERRASSHFDMWGVDDACVYHPPSRERYEQIQAVYDAAEALVKHWDAAGPVALGHVVEAPRKALPLVLRNRDEPTELPEK